jgi:hypothetical protein
MDQADRMPLLAAMRAAKLMPMRGAYPSLARGALSPLIRTEMKGKRLFLVDSQARHTMNALAGGYVFPMSKSGQQGTEPERGPHRTLIEGLEAAAYVICSSAGNSLTDELHLASNPHGAQYFTSLPRR